MAIAEDLSARIGRVAVIDDDPVAAEATSIKLEEAGFKTVLLEDGFEEVGELVSAVQAAADAAVCDHRLTISGYAPFDGAEAVAALVAAEVPALLVTKFAVDFAVSIRQHRAAFPVVMERAELGDPEAVRDAFRACIAELLGQTPPERRLWRTLFSVESITTDSGKTVVDVLIPSWDSEQAVRFPVDLVDAQLREQVQPGTAWFARINVGARRAEDLVFRDFEPAAEPDPEDGLA